jgi:hypothetical protein
MNKIQKKVLGVGLLCLMFILPGMLWGHSTPNPGDQTDIWPANPPMTEYNYIVGAYNTSSTTYYYAKNCTNGNYDVINTNANTVIQYALNNGNSTYVMSGTYTGINLNITACTRSLTGAGVNLCTLEPATSDFALTVAGTGGVNTAYPLPGIFSGFSIKCLAANSGGIELWRVQGATVENILVYGATYAYYVYGGHNNRIVQCWSESCTNGFWCGGSSQTELETDMWFTNDLCDSCATGFYMGEGANGFMITSCGAGCCGTGYAFVGTWSGGWVVNSWADQCTLDGWDVQSGTYHGNLQLQMDNIWGQSCYRGLCVNGTSSECVTQLQVENGLFNNNKYTGVTLAGNVTNSRINAIIESNAINGGANESTDVYLYDTGALNTFYDCQIGLSQSTTHEVIRIVMDSGAVVYSVTEFDACWLLQPIPNQNLEKWGLVNQNPTKEIDVFASGNIQNELPLTSAPHWYKDSASTGTINFRCPWYNSTTGITAWNNQQPYV